MARRPVSNPGNMKRGLQAFAFLVLIITFNGLLYGLIDYLPKKGIITGGSFFLALVLFLSFALSIAILLIVALGERLNSEKIENEWIKKIGVTPIMVIVAVLISVAVSFSPLAKQILPTATATGPHIMLADIGVTCNRAPNSEDPPPAAPRLLTVISAPDAEYIGEVRDFFEKRQQDANFSKKYRIAWVKQERSDRNFQLLEHFKGARDPGAQTLSESLKIPQNWLAYTVPLNEPHTITPLPVPSIFQKKHKTWVFVVTANLDRVSNRNTASTANLALSLVQPALSEQIKPLFHVDIGAKWQDTNWQQADLAFEMFGDQSCWVASADSGGTQ